MKIKIHSCISNHISRSFKSHIVPDDTAIGLLGVGGNVKLK